MLHETIQAHELGEAMRSYAEATYLLKKQNLNMNWVRTFTPARLTESCLRMAEVFPDMNIFYANVQRELIQNKAFLPFLVQLVCLSSPEQTDAGHPGILRAPLGERLSDLLEVCWSKEKNLTSYPADQVLSVLEAVNLDSDTRLIFLENFASMELSEEDRQMVIDNLSACVQLPLTLIDEQKWLLCDPVAAGRAVFCSTGFCEIWKLLESHPALLDILQLMHRYDISENLTLRNYAAFSQNVPQYVKHLTAVVGQLGQDAACKFIWLWQKSECSLYELQRMERRITENPEQDWNAVFANYSGYVNLLYGNRFKKLDMTRISSSQERLLVYAVTHQKKHFIRLADANGELFRSLSMHSILFDTALYEEHINLNELTERDLNDCAWMKDHTLRVSQLQPGRVYTFPEIRALYGTSKTHVTFYNMLMSKSQDYRLKVFRQVVNNDILQADMSSSELAVLADRFDEQAPIDWLQKDFGHIAGLTARDAARILLHLEQVKHLLPSMRCRTDALLVMQNPEAMDRFSSIAEVRENLLQVDTNWTWLAEEMKLSEDFVNRYQESILSFLCSNGAKISRTYFENLDNSQHLAFQRVVKADLMGQFAKLKYFEDDLQKELNYPVSDRLKAGWEKCLVVKENKLTVQEYDDFFSTILLGTQPLRTCLAYDGGGYCSCLLSSFDSNKKVLYATLNGKIVGRAFLRLTKGSMTAQTNKNKKLGFADLDAPSEPSQENQQKTEHLTLFLERSYIGGVGPEMVRQIQKLFISLAVQKADELNTMLVLSVDYCNAALTGFTQTLYHIYISKSKAGAQYLDSLSGKASVSDEGKYRTSRFFIRECTASDNCPEGVNIQDGFTDETRSFQ